MLPDISISLPVTIARAMVSITITSSRPLTDAELNIIVKIQEGNAIRLQHIKNTL